MDANAREVGCYEDPLGDRGGGCVLGMREGGVRCVLTVGGLAPETGGPATAIPTLCDGLSALGADVELVSVDLASSPLQAREWEPRGWRLTLVRCAVRKGFRLTWAPGFSRRVMEACKRLGKPVVHDNGVWLPSNHAAVGVARVLGAPLVVSPRGMLMPWALSTKAAKKAMAWWLYQARDLRSVTLFHATSTAELDALRRLGFRQPVAVVPNVVRLPPGDLRSTPPRDYRVALFLSRLTPKKGLDSLLRVWLQLRPVGWKLIVAGPDEGGYGERLLRSIPDNGLNSGVEFVGPAWEDGKWRLLREANVFVLPSLSENFGIAIGEALASCVPVITTKETPWEMIEENRCGWWIDKGDAALSAALKGAIALSDEERAKMGARGRLLIARECSQEVVSRQMAGVYRWLLDQGPRPDCVVDAPIEQGA